MRNLNVIDLDKTLLPFDSMGRLFFRFLFKKQTFLQFLFIALKRKSGLASRSVFFKKVIFRLQETCPPGFWENYADELLGRIDPEMLAKINQYTGPETLNVLCSASPISYVGPLAKKLGWKAFASETSSERDFHFLYGEEKKKLILAKFPRTEWHYHFSISDSKSDLDLLELFEIGVFYSPK